MSGIFIFWLFNFFSNLSYQLCDTLSEERTFFPTATNELGYRTNFFEKSFHTYTLNDIHTLYVRHFLLNGESNLVNIGSFNKSNFKTYFLKTKIFDINSFTFEPSDI